jgi:hypothetical protein
LGRGGAEGAHRSRQLRAARRGRLERLKVRTRDRQFLAIVQELATWRELEARRRDLPRQRIIRDDLLMEVAANKPRSVEELRSLERVNVDRESAAGIAATVARALAIPARPPPQLPEPPQLPRGTGPVIDLLKVLLKQRCEAADVAQKLVANGGDLEAIALDDAAPSAALQGWRREIFGNAALALKRGELALAVGRPGRDGASPRRRPGMARRPRLAMLGGHGFIAGHVAAALPAERSCPSRTPLAPGGSTAARRLGRPLGRPPPALGPRRRGASTTSQNSTPPT